MRTVQLVLILLLAMGLLWHLLGEPATEEGSTGHSEQAADAQAPVLAGTERPVPDEDAATERGQSSSPPAVGQRPGAGPITVTVLDAEGRPIPHAGVFLRRGTRLRGAHAAEDGRVTLRDIDLLERWDLQVWAGTSHSGFRQRDWLPRDLTVELERALKITGRVVDENDVPATDYRVRYRSEGADGGEVSRARLDKQGAFEISARAGAAVSLWVQYGEFHERLLPGAVPLALPPRRVEAGTRDVVLQVFRGGVIHLECADGEFDPGTPLIDAGPQAPSAVLTSERTGKVLHGVVDLAGHAVFVGLPAEGPWRLSIIGTLQGNYVDQGGLRAGRKTQRVHGKPGGTISGSLELPRDLPAHKVIVWAEHPKLGAARGHVDSPSRTFRIRGLPPGQAWTVHAVGLAEGGQGAQPTHRAQAPARAGQEVHLSLE